MSYNSKNDQYNVSRYSYPPILARIGLFAPAGRTLLARITFQPGWSLTTGVSQIRLMDSHVRLAEAQARTDEQLSNLRAVVDRYFGNGRKG